MSVLKQPVNFNTGRFVSDGKEYAIDARIMFNDGTGDKMIYLSKDQISEIDIMTKVGQLYSTGFVKYEDPTGQVARAIGSFDSYFIIAIQSFDQQSSGNFSQDIPDDKNQFAHSFIIDNIEIEDRDKNSISYCIHLTGTEYKNLLNHVTYSDYDQDQKKSLVELIKEMITRYGQLPIDDSFDKVTSGVTMNYISNGNDTVQTSIDYLLQKQFFFKDSCDSGMKILLYDVLTGKYGMFQPGLSEPDWVYNGFLSFNDSQMESLVASETVQLRSNSTFRKSDVFFPISEITIRDFSQEANDFSFRKIGSSEIVKFFGNGSANKIIPVIKDPQTNISREYSTWSNDSNIYKDLLNFFLNWDSVEIYTGAIVGRKLMSVFALLVDDRPSLIDGQTTEQHNEDMQRYNSLQGGWFITKIQHIINPNQGRYRQCLQLSRIGNAG